MTFRFRSNSSVDLERIESDHIEPGVVSAFRIVVGVQFVITLLAIIVAARVQPTMNLRSVVIYTLGWIGILFIYLSWPKLRRSLRHWYLPIALAMGTIGPIVPMFALFMFASGLGLSPLREAEIVNTGWRLLLILLVPLVFGAWQYRSPYVITYSIAITILSLTIGILSFGTESEVWSTLIDQSLTGGVTFLLVGLVITQLVHSQHEKQKSLAEANARLIEAAATTEKLAVSRERNRMARDLHDTLAHTLSAVSIQLEAVDSGLDHSPEQARKMLARTLANARSGLNETRRALQALRASPLDDLGLVLALRNLAEITAARTGIDLSVNLPTEVVLPPELEQNIYRIAQEAIENVVRHANASRLSILLQVQNQFISLEIEDDGVGFEKEAVHGEGHYGLRGMEERAALFGATLNIASQLQQGTRVQLIVQKYQQQEGAWGSSGSDSVGTV